MENIKFDFFERLINNIHLEILEHGLFLGDTAWRFYKVNSPFNRLYFMLEGESYIEDARGRIPLVPGNMYLIPLHSNYDYICDSRFCKFYVHMRLELFAGFDVFNDFDGCLSVPFTQESAAKFLDKVQSSRAGNMIFCKGFILDAVSQLLEPVWHRFAGKVDSAYKYRELYRFVRENCCCGLSVKQISQGLQMSSSSLSSSFKSDTGQTLKSFINHSIIQTAKEKMLLTNMSIKEIAYSLKFADEFYFSRFFKKHTGLSPREYRMKNKM